MVCEAKPYRFVDPIAVSGMCHSILTWLSWPLMVSASPGSNTFIEIVCESLSRCHWATAPYSNPPFRTACQGFMANRSRSFLVVALVQAMKLDKKDHQILKSHKTLWVRIYFGNAFRFFWEITIPKINTPTKPFLGFQATIIKEKFLPAKTYCARPGSTT